MPCDLLFKDFKTRLETLEHFLQKPLAQAKDGAVSQEGLDQTRAYVVSVYAETETFIEAISLALQLRVLDFVSLVETEVNDKKKIAKSTAQDGRKYLLPLVDGDKNKRKEFELILSCKILPKDLNVEGVFKYLRSQLKSRIKNLDANNSLNKSDMAKMFDKSGYDTENDFFELRNDLNILTTRRCQFAHQGIVSAVNDYIRKEIQPATVIYEPDPKSEKELASKVIINIRKLIDGLPL